MRLVVIGRGTSPDFLRASLGLFDPLRVLWCRRLDWNWGEELRRRAGQAMAAAAPSVAGDGSKVRRSCGWGGLGKG
jgi:hypothetical protein